MPALTAAAKARRVSRGTFGGGPLQHFDDFTLYDRCITRGLMGSQLPVLYGNGLRIVQTPNEVAISYEMIHDTRVIPLDKRPHIDASIEQYMGNARGHWEGDTLVVETHELHEQDEHRHQRQRPAHSDKLKMTETFTRIDPEMIDYRARIEDPATYTAPFTIRLTITKQPNYETLRVLVPRRQRRGGTCAQRRTRVRAASRGGQGEGSADSAALDASGVRPPAGGRRGVQHQPRRVARSLTARSARRCRPAP